MATVFALIEYLPIGANGAAGEAVLSEHATPEAALAAKQALYEQRPELVGCLVIRSGVATLKQKGSGDAGGTTGGAGSGGDGAQGAGGRGRSVPALPALRPAGR